MISKKAIILTLLGILLGQAADAIDEAKHKDMLKEEIKEEVTRQLKEEKEESD